MTPRLRGRRTLTVAEAAAELGVSRQVVRRWLREERLHGFRLRDGLGAWRIYVSSIRRCEGGCT